MKIYVAGHTGLVGSALVREIEAAGIHTWVGKPRKELDLFDFQKVKDYILEEKPDAIIIAAAKVGGIGANATYPATFLTENLRIATNLLDAAHFASTPKVLFLGSSCIYPRLAQQPIKEEALLTGPLEPTNEGYAIAKIAGIKLTQFYAKQFGHEWITAQPTNIYGPGDNYDPNSSHVLPALIHKFHEAKIMKSKSVELWGDGSPKREFLFSQDLAKACILLLEKYNSAELINVGVGQDISISDLASTVQKIVGYDGEIKWNTDMPNGTPRKVLDVSKILNLGWTAESDLTKGITETYAAYLRDKE